MMARIGLWSSQLSMVHTVVWKSGYAVEQMLSCLVYHCPGYAKNQIDGPAVIMVFMGRQQAVGMPILLDW